MEQIKVSAIITTHNRLELLKRAINSVLTQTYSNIECIVVSDNSSDGTDEYCSKLDNIIYISIPANESKGGNYARNLGIKASTGKYVALLDDDDYWLPQKIQLQVNEAEKKKCGLVYCPRTDEIVHGLEITFRENNVPECIGDMSKKILYQMFTTSSAILVRRDMLISVGLFDEDLKFWQDYELLVRLAQVTFFYRVEKSLMVYHVDYKDTGRLTNKYDSWICAVKYIRKKHKQLYNRLGLREYMLYKLMVWYDAVYRCKTSGLTLKMHYYQILIRLNALARKIIKLFKY